jgi:RNA polymerase sigma-70 factor (ECF subfamily)
MEAEPFLFNVNFLHRFKEGDESAFEKVFKADYNRIVGFCQQFTGDKDQAQSLAQEAFVKLWLNRGKIETVNGIHSFLFTAAKTDCLNYIRHENVIGKYQDKKLQLKEGELNREILESFDFDQLELLELEKMIIQSIKELPEKCRLVFELSRIEGKKNGEIAAQLNITVKSVEANMTRALKTLRLKLAEYLPLILVQLIMKNF